jgi:hypothetical protein
MKANPTLHRETVKKPLRHLRLVNSSVADAIASSSRTLYLDRLVRATTFVGIIGLGGLIQKMTASNFKGVVHYPHLLGVIGLSYLLAARSLGYRVAARGLLACILGSRVDDPRNEELAEFGKRFSTWALWAAHLCALLTITRTTADVLKFGGMVIGDGISSIYCGYLYAGVLIILSPRDPAEDRTHIVQETQNKIQLLMSLTGILFLVMYAIQVYR